MICRLTARLAELQALDLGTQTTKVSIYQDDTNTALTHS